MIVLFLLFVNFTCFPIDASLYCLYEIIRTRFLSNLTNKIVYRNFYSLSRNLLLLLSIVFFSFFFFSVYFQIYFNEILLGSPIYKCVMMFQQNVIGCTTVGSYYKVPASYLFPT